MGRSGPHLIRSSLGPPKSSTQTASRYLQPFLQGKRSVQPLLHNSGQSVPILYNGPPPHSKLPLSMSFPVKIVVSHGTIWTPSNTWFLGHTRVLNPNGISIGSAVLSEPTTVTDRQTDNPFYSVCNNRPHQRTSYCDAANNTEL